MALGTGKMHTQADERRSYNIADQFGRSWLIEIELKTGEPTGVIQPAGWTDPLRTPQKYLRLKAPTQLGGGGLYVDVDRWVEDHRQALTEWRKSLWIVGQQKYQNKFDPRVAEEDEFLLTMTGPKPWPSVEVLQALPTDTGYQGKTPLTPTHRKALGVPTLEDLSADLSATMPQAQPLEPGATTYKAFLAEALKQGKTMAEAAELWHLHKSALEES